VNWKYKKDIGAGARMIMFVDDDYEANIKKYKNMM
jgi:hypothetical protein